MSILGGDKEIRTLDPLLAKQVLYQLSYTPESGCKYISIFAICKFFLLFMVKKRPRITAKPHIQMKCTKIESSICFGERDYLVKFHFNTPGRIGISAPSFIPVAKIVACPETLPVSSLPIWNLEPSMYR